MDKQNQLIELIKSVAENNNGTHIDYAIPGYAAKKVMAYFDMYKDLSLIRQMTLNMINLKQDEIVYISFFYTVIMLYGKCFTDASNTSTPKLDEDKIFLMQDEKLLKTHKDVMNLRHNEAAHRSNLEEIISMTYIEMYFDPFGLQVKYKAEKRKYPDKEVLNNYLTLINYVISIVHNRIINSAQKTWNHLQKDYTPQQLSMMAFAGPSKEKIMEILKNLES